MTDRTETAVKREASKKKQDGESVMEWHELIALSCLGQESVRRVGDFAKVLITKQ